jgi:hypothetical protein
MLNQPQASTIKKSVILSEATEGSTAEGSAVHTFITHT